MIPADETFDGTFAFAPHFSEAPGFKMHYVDEGEGTPIICLHGQPTWSYLYRNFIPPLSKHHRVIVPDHMGFGKSETPQNKVYTLRTHVENLTALIEDLDLRDITFVAQDWGGPIAAGYTLRHSERVARLCLMNTIAGYGPLVPDKEAAKKAAAASAEVSPWFQWVGTKVADGSYETIFSNLDKLVLSIMKVIGFENSAAVDATWLRAYGAHFVDAAACKGGIEFPLDVIERRIVEFLMEGAPNLEKMRAIPAMLAEGMHDNAILPSYAIADFKALWPDGPVVTLDNAGHFCQEDAPETLVALIKMFIQTTA